MLTLEKLEDRNLLTNYAITDLGTLGGSKSYATAIFDSTHIAGSSFTPGERDWHAFTYDGTSLTDLGVPSGYDKSNARGINATGRVAGYLTDSAEKSHAFFYNGSTIVDLGTLGDPDAESEAYGINGSNHVVGASQEDENGAFFAFYYDGTMTEIPNTLGGTSAGAFAINRDDVIVGRAATSTSLPGHAFRYTVAGGMEDLGTLGGTNSWAWAVNDDADVAGWSNPTGSSDHHAFLFTSTTATMVDLGVLPGTGNRESEAFGVNDSGQVVGFSTTSETYPYDRRAFLWESGTLYNLNDLVSPSTHGWTLGDARAISDEGQIVGRGVNPDGDQHAYLLTPITPIPPPPGTNKSEREVSSIDPEELSSAFPLMLPTFDDFDRAPSPIDTVAIRPFRKITDSSFEAELRWSEDMVRGNATW